MPIRRRQALLAFALPLAAGCASPGDPTPRQSPVIPQAVQDLTASQQGDQVVLRFTLPDQSVRNEPLPAPPAIDIYRGAVENQGQPVGAVSTRLVYTIPGEMAQSYNENGWIVYHERIEPQELVRAGSATSERVYLVRTRVERSRASTESNRVLLAIHPPPPPVAMVRARLIRTNAEPPSLAVVLEWPGNDNSVYYLYRAEIVPNGVVSSSTDRAQTTTQAPFVKIGEVRTSQNANDPITQYQDSKVEFGHRYMYVVRSVLEFIGPYIVTSADSQPTLITVAETVPPAAPEELQAVLIPATPPEPASVSLSWAIAQETNVTGYVVYRSEQEGDRGARLNDRLLGSPTYRDRAVEAGRHYFYTVTAVNSAGMESAPSTAVEAQIPEP